MPELVPLSCLDSKSFKSYFEQHGNFRSLLQELIKCRVLSGKYINTPLFQNTEIPHCPTILLGSALPQYEVFPIRLSGWLPGPVSQNIITKPHQCNSSLAWPHLHYNTYV